MRSALLAVKSLNQAPLKH